MSEDDPEEVGMGVRARAEIAERLQLMKLGELDALIVRTCALEE